MKKLKESEILDKIKLHFTGHKYQLLNSFIFEWESDYFAMSSYDYTYEIKIITSAEQFRACSKNLSKHNALYNIYNKIKNTKTWTRNKKVPNKFYYCVPKGLLGTNQVPEYAGLIYITSGFVKEVKKAPLIHKTKFDLNDILLQKFYNLSVKLQNKLNINNIEVVEPETVTI